MKNFLKAGCTPICQRWKLEVQRQGSNLLVAVEELQHGDLVGVGLEALVEAPHPVFQVSCAGGDLRTLCREQQGKGSLAGQG